MSKVDPLRHIGEIKPVTTMKGSKKLIRARSLVELAINEEGKRADGRVYGAGRSYGVEARYER